MLAAIKNIFEYRELLRVLMWKNISLQFKQSYLGISWAVFRPLILLAIFMIVRSFVGIDSGEVPYALLTYCAMVPWMYFQNAASDSVGSVVRHASLVKKIYFPREIFPLSSMLSKTLELGVGFIILSLLMVWYDWAPTWQVLWSVPLILYTMLTALTIGLAGAAVNVYARDMSQGIPLMLSMMMYVSPVMYPLPLVRAALLERQAAGEWSELIYTLYMMNPMAGVIEGMQRAVLLGQAPDWSTLLPGAILVAILLPLSYAFFKRAEAYFADVI